MITVTLSSMTLLLSLLAAVVIAVTIVTAYWLFLWGAR